MAVPFEPAGKHIIKVCTGTACHVKGSTNVYDAIARELQLKDGELTDSANLFTLEKVACLGCCTLAPVVKVDEITYGHVKPEEAGQLLKDFLEKAVVLKGKDRFRRLNGKVIQGEIRVGLGSCCIASGSAEVKTSMEEVLAETGINVLVKQVGCVGVCNQVPLLEIIKPGEPGVFYSRIKPEEVRDVILTHFKPTGFLSRTRTKLTRLLDRAVEEERPASFSRYGADQRDTPLCDFLEPQMAIATEQRGHLSPTSIEEYRASGGFSGLHDAFHPCHHRKLLMKLLPVVFVSRWRRFSDREKMADRQ